MLNFKYEVNKDFIKYKEFLLDIKKNFQDSKNSIHKARNEIKVIENQSLKLVVKAFKIPNFLNKIIYSFFRNSKAKKSYDYALKIGEFTPKPIGYIEFYENLLLNESFYISEKFDYNFTIREPLINTNFPKKEEIFKAFAKFTHSLHENEIYHLDFSPGNILVKKEEDEFIFKIVDINRMQFRPFCNNLRMQSFCKLWAKDEDLEIIIKEYAKIAGIDENLAINKAISYSHSLKARKNFKKRLRGQKVVD